MESNCIVSRGTLYHAFGTCSDDDNGKDHDARGAALLCLPYGTGGTLNSNNGGVRQGRHQADRLRTNWRSVVLDRMGGVPLPVLRYTMGHAARDCQWRGGDQARISYSACLVRHVDDDDDTLHILHEERLQLHQLVATPLARFAQKRDSGTSYDPSHKLSDVHGTEHDTLGKLSAADVLLRQQLPWRPPSSHQHRSGRLSAWQHIHLQEAAAPVVVGCQHTHGYSYGSGVLGASRSARTTRLLP